jgi:hypothetical protein
LPTDRVLIEIVTAANMAGVEEASAGMLGMNASTLGLAAALGGLIFLGKAAIDNTEAQRKAHLELQQATDVTKESFTGMQAAFDAWAAANKRFIPDQYAAEGALAAFVRTGVSTKTAMQELNTALDLSTLKGSDMATSQLTIVAALAGNARGLKQLGITTEEYNAIWKAKGLTQAQKQTELLDLMTTRTKDGRLAQTELTQSTQAMNKDWEDLTTRIGPPLLSLFTATVGYVDQLVTGLDNLGHNKDWNKAISGGLGDIQNALIDVVKGFEDIVGAVQWLGTQKTALGNLLGGSSTGGQGYRPAARAAGGPVSAGQSYLVGERGPEMFTAGSSGNITPNGAGGGITININNPLGGDGPYWDKVANQIAQRLTYATGR